MGFNVEKIVNQSREKRERIGKNIDEAFKNKSNLNQDAGKSHYIQVSHEGLILSFKHPAFKGTYGSVDNQINQAGLKRPNSAETASLIHDAFQNKEGQYKFELIHILDNKYFWEFTGNLYLPKSNEEINNGVILVDNPEIVDGRLGLDKNSLVERIQNNDKDVKFVPFGFKMGIQSPRKLAKNKYIIARYGEEGAEKISEIASKYKDNPCLYSVESVDEEKSGVSLLKQGKGGLINGSRLDIGSNYWFDGGAIAGEGHSFGVKK